MSSLHKKINFPLTRKYALLFLFFFLFGWYKNGLLPVMEGFYPKTHLVFLLLYPTLGFFLGFLFDKLFRRDATYNNRFFGVLLSFILPISTPIYVFLVWCFLLLLFNTFFIQKKDWDFNFVVFGYLLLVGYLYFTHQYQYSNALEESHLFVYSYLDGVFGYNVGGLFTSSVFLILLSFLFLSFDYYYKKEIPFYSYGFYLLTLILYSFWKGDLRFILANMLSSTILFALVFLAPLSLFSPYTRKRKVLYSFFLGVFILPFSLYFSFFEGVYFSLILANFIVILLNGVQNKLIR